MVGLPRGLLFPILPCNTLTTLELVDVIFNFRNNPVFAHKCDTFKDFTFSHCLRVLKAKHDSVPEDVRRCDVESARRNQQPRFVYMSKQAYNFSDLTACGFANALVLAFGLFVYFDVAYNVFRALFSTYQEVMAKDLRMQWKEFWLRWNLKLAKREVEEANRSYAQAEAEWKRL
ncbi:hypothetical protein BJ508DRAFT_373263 [Ascobolus immersus RN42]|uniref:Uncharacterized protein n=1 Tax=Ascobolus immersus RN42 TaxID=1160509 RepID=A0A3N4IIJ2_ASCIM|nr:hypothetical protein BJ508DRAFT_373263 [Ascobolus immersus RN42]